MKYMYKRFFAYVLDMVIVLVLASFISNIRFINPSIGKYDSYNTKYQNTYITYQGFISDFNRYYSDNKLSDNEYSKLNKRYKDNIKYIDKYYSDNKITKSEYKKIIKDVNKDFKNIYKDLYYNVNKYSVVYDVILIVLILLYFVLFNVIFNGQTLGMKVMGIKVIGVNKENISFINYLVRTVILYNPIYYLLIIIGNYIFDVNDFYNYSLVLSNIKDYLLVIIILMMIIRKDRRGLHDMLSKTKVIDIKSINKKKVIEGEES